MLSTNEFPTPELTAPSGYDLACRRVLVAIPTQGRRNLRMAITAWRSIQSMAAVVFFVDANAPSSLEADIRQSGINCIPLESSGYASVRNEIMSWATGKADYIIFFDDDQVPAPGWLDALLLPLSLPNSRRPHVVFGPVVGVPEGRAPIHAEDVRREYRPTGGPDGLHLVPYSGNTLIDLRLVSESGILFEPRFDTVGGEDTDFFVRLKGKGARVHFAKDAVAFELIDASRRSLAARYHAGVISSHRKRALGLSRPRAILSTGGALALTLLYLLRGTLACDARLTGLGLFWLGRLTGPLAPKRLRP